MKVRNWKNKVAMSLVAAGVGSFTATARADIITTLEGTGLANNAAIPDGHGSHAEATLVWSPDGNTPSTNWDAYETWPNGGLVGVYQVDGLRPWISFTPVAGFRIQLDQFDFNVWAGGQDTIYEIRIFNGTAPGADGTELALFSGTAPDAFGTYSATQSTITPVVLNFLGGFDQSLTIEFRQLSGTGANGSYLAMDNFTFQTISIPEPGTFALLGLGGLGAAAMRRRRDK